MDLSKVGFDTTTGRLVGSDTEIYNAYVRAAKAYGGYNQIDAKEIIDD